MSASKSEVEELGTQGQLVWARLDPYPFWPAVVVYHENSTYVKMKGGKVGYNVMFLEDAKKPTFAQVFASNVVQSVNMKEESKTKKFLSKVPGWAGAVEIGVSWQEEKLLPSQVLDKLDELLESKSDAKETVSKPEKRLSYCYCQVPALKSKKSAMVECVLCRNWYHELCLKKKRGDEYSTQLTEYIKNHKHNMQWKCPKCTDNDEDDTEPPLTPPDAAATLASTSGSSRKRGRRPGRTPASTRKRPADSEIPGAENGDAKEIEGTPKAAKKPRKTPAATPLAGSAAAPANEGRATRSRARQSDVSMPEAMVRISSLSVDAAAKKKKSSPNTSPASKDKQQSPEDKANNKKGTSEAQPEAAASGGVEECVELSDDDDEQEAAEPKRPGRKAKASPAAKAKGPSTPGRVRKSKVAPEPAVIAEEEPMGTDEESATKKTVGGTQKLPTTTAEKEMIDITQQNGDEMVAPTTKAEPKKQQVEVAQSEKQEPEAVVVEECEKEPDLKAEEIVDKKPEEVETVVEDQDNENEDANNSGALPKAQFSDISDDLVPSKAEPSHQNGETVGEVPSRSASPVANDGDVSPMPPGMCDYSPNVLGKFVSYDDDVVHNSAANKQATVNNVSSTPDVVIGCSPGPAVVVSLTADVNGDDEDDVPLSPKDAPLPEAELTPSVTAAE